MVLVLVARSASIHGFSFAVILFDVGFAPIVWIGVGLVFYFRHREAPPSN